MEYKKQKYAYKGIFPIYLSKILKGQAKSAYYLLKWGNLKDIEPVTILPCDMTFKINEKLIKKLDTFDLIVWTIKLKNYAKLNPNITL